MPEDRKRSHILQQQILKAPVQAPGQVLPHLHHRATDSALKTFLPGGAVTFHHDPLQPEEARAIVPGGRQLGLQPAQDRQRENPHQP